MPEFDINDIATGAIANLLATIVVAGTAYIFRQNIKRALRSSVLKSKHKSPAMTLEVDFIGNSKGERMTSFIIENTGDIEISDLRLFVITNFGHDGPLEVKRIFLEDERKWINSGGHRMSARTVGQYDGESGKLDRRYFIEFMDDVDGTIYRMSQGGYGAKYGSNAFYGTLICQKRLPKRGFKAKGSKKWDSIKKYEIDLAVG